LFGYIKPRYSDLLVKEDNIYKALYCGLCGELKKISLFATATLNYDFVALALFRAAITGEKFKMCKKRCSAHPLKKRPMVMESESLAFMARLTVIFSVYKLLDDCNDKDKALYKRIVYRSYALLLKRKLKKVYKNEHELLVYEEHLKKNLSVLSQLEKEGCSDLDSLCIISGDSLKEAMGYGLSGAEKRIAENIGDCMGRYIYMIDLCDDLEDDEKSGAFNPLLIRYNSAHEARKHLDEVDLVMSIYAKNISASLDLIENHAYIGILKNITDKGFADVSAKVMNKEEVKNVRSV